jgi:lysophospholipid acyltransferase (LPLAT)-like uncharacterized protein
MLGTIDEPEFKIAGLRLKARTLAWFVSGFIIAINKTLRVRTVDESGFLDNPPSGGCIFTFWHNRLFAMPMLFKLYYGKRRGLVGLSSASGEGTLLTMILERFGIRTVRGSSSRQGSAAARGLMREIQDGFDVVITPDGPRGPRYQLNPGLIFLAQRTGLPIQPVSVECGQCWRLGTWDRFMIPLPFSKIVCTFQPQFFVPPVENPAQLEEQRVRLERLMQLKTD